MLSTYFFDDHRVEELSSIITWTLHSLNGPIDVQPEEIWLLYLF